LLPIWEWHPLLVGIFVFVIDFGAIAAIRVLQSRSNLMHSSETYLYGDSLALPVFAVGMAVVVQHGDAGLPSFFRSRRWHLLVLATGCLLALAVDGGALIQGTHSVFVNPTPSKVYHTFVFVPMFYLVASALPVLFQQRRPLLAVSASLGGLSLYLLLAIADLRLGAGTARLLTLIL
jgi:hypothetical protein